MANSEILAELESIRLDNGGLLRPENVVERARNPKNVLHSRFEWNNKIAADEHRLWQARRLIEVTVYILPQTNKLVRSYVSLKSDRILDGGGYRSFVEVMNDEERRHQLLVEALEEFRGFETKYHQLEELAPVFEAAHKVKVKTQKKQAVAVR